MKTCSSIQHFSTFIYIVQKADVLTHFTSITPTHVHTIKAWIKIAHFCINNKLQSRSMYQKPFVWIRISRTISYHKANIKISSTIPIFYLYHHSTYQQFSFFTFSMSDTLVRATIISSDNFTMMHLLQTSSSLKLNHSQI